MGYHAMHSSYGTQRVNTPWYPGDKSGYPRGDHLFIKISFVTGALRELGVALVKGNDHEVVYREALHVYDATAGGTAARVGATVPTVDPE
jgi:hypothetical protein